MLANLIESYDAKCKGSLNGKNFDLPIDLHFILHKAIKSKGLVTSSMIFCLLESIINSKNPNIKQIEELVIELQELSEQNKPTKTQNILGIPSFAIGGTHLRDACLKKVIMISARSNIHSRRGISSFTKTSSIRIQQPLSIVKALILSSL